MRLSCLLALALLAMQWGAGARAEEPKRTLDNAPPVPPATEAAMAQPAATQNAPTAAAVSSAPAVSANTRALAPDAVPVFAPAPPPGATAPTGGDEPASTTPLATEPDPPPPAAASTSIMARTPPSAVDPLLADHKQLHLAAAAGIGATFDRTVGNVNPLGFGFGVRGDYRVLDELSIGGRFLYFVGGSSQLPTGKVGMSSWLLAAEAAYVLNLPPILLEPGLALGIASRASDGPPALVGTTGQGFVPGSASQTRLGFYVAPGLNLVVPLTVFARDLDLFFIGADARLDLIFGHGVSGNLQLLAQAGLRL